MAKGTHWIIFITKKISKYARNIQLIIKEKIKKMTVAGIEPGFTRCWLSPRALRHTEFSQHGEKIGPFQFSKSDHDQVQ